MGLGSGSTFEGSLARQICYFFSTLNNMVGIFQSIYAQKKEKERHSRARKKMNCTKCKMYSITLNTHLNWHCWVEASRLFCFITVVDKILAINCPTFKEPNKCECACVRVCIVTCSVCKLMMLRCDCFFIIDIMYIT